MNKKFSFIFLGLCLVFMANGQSVKYTKQQKNDFLDADSYYIYGDYKTAAKMFKIIESVDPEFTELYFKVGYSHFQLKEYKIAVPYFKKGISFDNESLFYLTKIYLRQQNLAEADSTLALYSSNWRELYAKHSKDDIKLLKAKIEMAKKMIANPENVKILNLGENINTENHEYVPLIDGDESKLIFTSKKVTVINGLIIDELPFEEIYISYRNDDGSWKKPIDIPGNINSRTNLACVGLSTDGEKLFVFKPNENLYAGDIHESNLIDGKWTTPILLDDHINNYQSTESSATVSLDGNVIYFSSNREGGYGGFDIYRVVRLPNGEWSWAKNLGPTINTARNDDSPFLHPDGKTMYFSSEGHENMGGYDIFYSILEDGDWSSPSNLGYPINTTSDDVHFVISANEQHGYYSTEKESGFGGQDIYMIDYLEKKLRQSIIRGTVLNVEGNPIQSEVSLINIETGELEGVYKPRKRDGKFIFIVNPDVEYDLIVDYNENDEFTELVKYSIEELKIPQAITIQIK